MRVLDKHEGRYSNIKVDPGGETYRGISRVYWPNWPGWEVLSHEVELCNPSAVRHLDRLVMEFYRAQFWDRFQGDAVSDISEEVAIEVFECGVNLGIHRAVSFLQEALNLLNRNERDYPDILVDGKLGPVTLDTLSTHTKVNRKSTLLKVMNVLQGTHYIAQMRSHPEKEIFRGWFERT